jgi:hypothetical protein
MGVKSFSNINIIIGLFLTIVGIVILLLTQLSIHLLTAFSLIIVGLYIQNLSNQRRLLYPIILTSFVLTLLYLLFIYNSQIWHVFQLFSKNFISAFVRESINIETSINGVWIVIPFIIGSLFFTTLITSEWRSICIKFSGYSVVLLIVWKLYYYVGISLGYFNVEELFFFLGGLFVVELVVFFGVFRRYLISQNGQVKYRSFSWLLGKKHAVIAVVLLVLLLGSLVIMVPFGSGRQEKMSVAFYAEDMLGSWDHPEYGRYGRDASGMYGLLPMYLDSLSYDCSIIVENVSTFVNRTYISDVNSTRYVNLSEYVGFVESSSLCDVDFSLFDILVIIGHNRSLSPEEYICIWEFVADGGGLLVLGDHTDVGGMRDPLNALLSPVDIKFRFDSALPIDDRWKWETSADFFNDWLIGTGFDIRDSQISVGASLDVGIDSFPLILGRFGFSDEGDVENEDFAFLGDYRYEMDEQLGDVVLAAGAWYGEGRVVVFGDTSSFQNSAIPRSHGMVDGVFQWLGAVDSNIGGFWWNVLVLVLIGVFGIIFIVYSEKISVAIIGITIMTFLLVLSSMFGSISIVGDEFNRNHVVIDVAYIERFSLDPFLEDSLSGVILNFQRNGFFPVYVRNEIDMSVCTASFVVLNAPTRRLSDDTVSGLMVYMENGGVVVSASGFLEKEAVMPLIGLFGMDIDNVPLGPVPYVEEDPALFEYEPRFVNSWPIRFESEEARSFYNFSWNDMVYHLMVFQPVGNGGLLVISDSEFLLDENVESIYDYWPGNIIFLKRIIDEVMGSIGVY